LSCGGFAADERTGAELRIADFETGLLADD
jgi:hypothetical protein